MTGGGAEINIRSMEVLKDDGPFHCSLTDLPRNHFGHTQTVSDVCGSAFYRISCLSLTSAGVWEESRTIVYTEISIKQD